MNDLEKGDDILAAEYALGTLRGPARLQFQKRVAEEPELAARVAYWQEMFSVLDSHLAPILPPEEVWKKIALDMPSQTPVRRVHAWAGWLVAAGLAAVTIFTWVSTREQPLTPLVVLNDAQQQEQWVVSADERRQTLSLTPMRPTALAAQHSLQLWLIPDGKAPVSLGLVDARSPTQVEVKGLTIAANAAIAISLEPQGGSPTGQPTGPVLYSGKL